MDEGKKEITLAPIGEAIKELINKKDLSYEDLSRKSKISKPYIAEIIAYNRVPKKDKIESLAFALEIDPFYFREYRKIKLNEYIEENPETLNYTTEDQLCKVISLNHYLSEFQGITPEFVKEMLNKKISPLEEAVVLQNASFNIFVQALVEMVELFYPNSKNEEDIKLIGELILRLRKKID